MSGTSDTRGELRCCNCNKLLSVDGKIKCPRCKRVNSFAATALPFLAVFLCGLLIIGGAVYYTNTCIESLITAHNQRNAAYMAENTKMLTEIKGLMTTTRAEMNKNMRQTAFASLVSRHVAEAEFWLHEAILCMNSSPEIANRQLQRVKLELEAAKEWLQS